jgi:hypothetical protein
MGSEGTIDIPGSGAVGMPLAAHVTNAGRDAVKTGRLFGFSGMATDGDFYVPLSCIKSFTAVQ